MTRRYLLTYVFAVAALTSVVSARGADTYGKGVTLKETVTVAELYAAPQKFAGKTIRIDGVVSQVCEEMGCWIAIAATDNKDLAVRFKVDESEKIVFPLTARGKRASAEGVFQKIAADDKEGHEAAGEQTASASAKAAAFGKAYQVKATGAIVY